jgi:hypothetical protein
MVLINITPPRTPTTIVWNKNLLHYDSKVDNQQFKAVHVCRQTFPSLWLSDSLAHIFPALAWVERYTGVHLSRK